MNNHSARLGVGVIGAGRVGAVLASALRSTGHAVIGASGVSDASLERIDTLLPGVPVLDARDIVERAELVLVTVPDDALVDLVSGLAEIGAWQNGQIVVHTAGRYGVGILEPARSLGAIPLAIHPAMTFTGTSMDITRLNGASFAVTAPKAAIPIAQALVIELGGEPFVIEEESRSLYHAALSHGSNHSAVLIGQAARALEAAGVGDPLRVLTPLVSASIDNALRDPDRSATGPIVRGDIDTVRVHIAALSSALENDPTVVDSYRVLARAAIARAVTTGRISESVAAQLLDAVAGGQSE